MCYILQYFNTISLIVTEKYKMFYILLKGVRLNMFSACVFILVNYVYKTYYSLT